MLKIKMKQNYGVTIQMQATLERNEIRMKETKKEINNLNNLLRSLETADNKVKNEIENKIVGLGETVIPELITYLQNIKGAVRGVVAMVIIRMGECSISYLKNAASTNSDFEWMAKYLISEINVCPELAA